jgi:hypothetical protein
MIGAWSNKERAAWMAAMIDGEGCIRLKKLSSCNIARSPSYCVHLIITGTDRKLLDFLVSEFGGSIGKRSVKNSSHRQSWGWFLYGKRAIEILESVLPYLIIKKQQAEMMIEYQKQSIHKNGKKLSASELCYRDYLFFKMKELNSRGTEIGHD